MSYGIPPGGLPGQVLVKSSANDYDVIWVDWPQGSVVLAGGTPSSTPSSTLEGGTPILPPDTSVLDGGTV